ncbi:MAG: hypothetical protein IKP88_08045 [Lachnospiraceae bacterium]|nr:hypothetical protein [Lachnospiraceae bacterium]
MKMKKLYKGLFKKTALFLVVVMTVFSLAGCGMLDETVTPTSAPQNGGNQGSTVTGTEDEKGILDDFLDMLDDGSGTSDSGSSSSDDDLMSMLFDAFLGGNSADYGWGSSSYSGSERIDSNFEYSDVSNVAAGSGSATIMVYIIGSNLESDSACATMDIQEMCNAKIGNNINVIVEAGGAKKWQNSVMSSGKVGRYRVVDEGIQILEEAKRKSMVEPSEVIDFINFSIKNFPADRYGFIFWNHGGGTLAGFGMDDNYSGDLSIDEISSALGKSGIHFDFVGFDACLMGTIETAFSLKNCADYLIAAEEEEPGYGWYYTNWLKALEKNPSLDMEQLGSIIIDDFVASNGSSDVTLSLIDLKKIPEVYEKLAELCAKGNAELYAGGYKTLSAARKKTKTFGEGNYDQIDIIDFCNNCGLEGADELIAAVNQAVKYHKTNIKGANGLAMYFPFDYPSYYKSMSAMLKSFGMNNSSCTGFFNNFLSGRSGGHRSMSVNPIEVKTGYESGKEEEDYTAEEWYNDEIPQADIIINFPVNDEGLLEMTEYDYGYVVELDEDHWNAVVLADIGVFVDDGEGYIDLGKDNAYTVDEYGNLIIDFDNLWVAIDGNVVPFYSVDSVTIDEDNWYTYGIVKAQLTSARTGETKDIEIILYWDGAHDGNGYIKGYRPASSADGPSQAERNVTSFIKGDKIQFTCDFYTYEGEYDDEYLLGGVVVGDSPLEVTYENIGDYDSLIYGHISDIYGNDYYTDFVSLTYSE